jgi:hypothetical protein
LLELYNIAAPAYNDPGGGAGISYQA